MLHPSHAATIIFMIIPDARPKPMKLHRTISATSTALLAMTFSSTLQSQLDETLPFLRGITEEKSLYRYAPEKWSIRQMWGHVNDTERVFLMRALWFARNFDTALPSFDQDIAVAAAGSDEMPWARHVEEFREIRLATISFFRNLPEEAWTRTGHRQRESIHGKGLRVHRGRACDASCGGVAGEVSLAAQQAPLVCESAKFDVSASQLPTQAYLLIRSRKSTYSLAFRRRKLYSQGNFRGASGLRAVPMSLKQPNTQRAPKPRLCLLLQAAEQALAQHKLVLETLLESTADFIYMKDREGRYVFVNPAAAESVGKSAEEIIGKDDRALFPEEHARQIMEKDRQIMASGISEVFEETRAYAGGVRHLHSSKNVCRDSSGAVIGIVGISRDITELKRAEEALNSSELNAAGARMANALAHEINNPLAALTNALFLLRQGDGSVPADELLGSAQESLWRITKITRQMIGLYNRTAAARHIQVQDVVKDTLANLDLRIKKKGIRCEVDLSPCEFYGIDADLRQLITALMENAVEQSRSRVRIKLYSRSTAAATRRPNSVSSLPTMALALRRSTATASLSHSFPPSRKKAAAWDCGWPAESPINMAAASACAAGPPKDLHGHAWR